MRVDSPAVYGCPKGGENGIHHWKANDDGIFSCLRCKLELSAEDSLDMKKSNERWFRELKKSRINNHENR